MSASTNNTSASAVATAKKTVKPMSINDEIMEFYAEKLTALEAERAKKHALFIQLQGSLFGAPAAGSASGLDFKAAAAAAPPAQLDFDFD